MRKIQSRIYPIFVLLLTFTLSVATASGPEHSLDLAETQTREVSVRSNAPEKIQSPASHPSDTTAFMASSPITAATSEDKADPNITDIKDDGGNLIRREYRNEKGDLTKKEHFTNGLLNRVEEFYMNKVLRAIIYGNDGKVKEQTQFIISGPAEGKSLITVYRDGETILFYEHNKYDGDGARTTKDTYDASSKLTGTQSFDPITGFTVTNIYEMGVLIRKEYRDTVGKLRKNEHFQNGTINLVQEFKYNDARKLSAEEVRFVDGKLKQEIWFHTTGPVEGKADEAKYYEHGDLSVSEKFEYNASGTMIGKVVHDAQGRLQAHHLFDPISQKIIELRSYDANERLNTAEWFDASGTRTAIEKYTYHANGEMAERQFLTGDGKAKEVNRYNENGELYENHQMDMATGKLKLVRVFDPKVESVIRVDIYDLTNNRIDISEYHHFAYRIGVEKYFYRSNGVLERKELKDMNGLIQKITYYHANGLLESIEHYKTTVVTVHGVSTYKVTLEEKVFYNLVGRDQGKIAKKERYGFIYNASTKKDEQVINEVDFYERGFPVLSLAYNNYFIDVETSGCHGIVIKKVLVSKIQMKTYYFSGTDQKKRVEMYAAWDRPAFTVSNGKIDYFADPGEMWRSNDYDFESGQILVASFYTRGTIRLQFIYSLNSDPNKPSSIKERLDIRYPASYLDAWLEEYKDPPHPSDIPDLIWGA